jgi:hypothetical protein
VSWGGISAKCAACGKGQHEPGFCDLAAELKGFAAKHEMELAS